jgi:WD40 repeat protein
MNGAHAAGHSAEVIQDGLEAITRAVCRLREDSDNLQRLKALLTVHIHQADMDIARLRHLHKALKVKVDAAAAAPRARERGAVEPTSIDWQVEASDAWFTQSRVRLRYALRMEAILCAVHFNHDGSLFSFTDGAAVFFVRSADGRLVGTCELPRPRSADDGHARAIRFSHDSQLLAVSGPGTSVTVVAVQPRQVVTTLDAHTNPVSTVAFFRKSPRLVTGAFDRKLCVWNTHDFRLLKSIAHGNEAAAGGTDDMIVAIAISADDEYVAVGFMNGVIGIYEPTFSQPMTSFAAHQEFLLNIAISSNNIIATASHDATAKLWTVRGIASCRQKLAGHTDYVLGVTFSPMDPIVFTGSKDETIKCWSVKHGANLFTLIAHKNTLFQIDHHPMQRTIVSCSGDGVICIWDYALPADPRHPL